MGWLLRTGGVLVAPRSTFRSVLHGRAGGLGDVLLLMFLVLLGTAPADVAAAVAGLDRGLSTLLSRLLLLYVHFSMTPLLVCVAFALVVVGAERFRGRRAPIEGVIAASAYLWVPLGVLGLLGSILRTLGLDLHFLPHVPVGIFIKTEPAWWAVALRMTVYGWSLYLAWVLARETRHEAGESREVPPLPAWAAWALGGWLLLSYAAGAVFVVTHYDRIRPVQVGDRAADFNLPRAGDGGEVKLSSLRGKPVVVEFWADWCTKCVGHMPRLAAWAREHPDVAVLAIHQGGTVTGVQAFVTEKKWKQPTFLVDVDGQASIAYRADTLPTFVVVDPEGRVAAIRLGAPPPGWLEQQLAGREP